MSKADVFAPVDAGGKRYWLSYHAADRAAEMGVPIQLMPLIIQSGEQFNAPPTSKYAGCYVFRAGKVALAVSPHHEGDVITTVLWATLDAWRDADQKAGRVYKGDEYTRKVLTNWFGADAA